MCVNSSVLKLLPQINFFKKVSQVSYFSQVCVSRCVFNTWAWLNFFKQVSHVKGFSQVSQVRYFSQVCVSRCVFNTWPWPNFFKQVSQVKDLSPVYVSWSVLKLLAWLNFYKLWKVSPQCVSIHLFLILGQINFFEQVSQVRDFFQVCVSRCVFNT